MSLSKEILDRVARVLDFHRASKPAAGAVAGQRPDAAQQPNPYRIFDGFPRIPLPASLLDVPVPALSILADGIHAIPESQHSPPQDLKTLATWLFMAYGVTGKRQVADRTVATRNCPSGAGAYPCEIYVAAMGIDGLEAGLYHYSVREYTLRKIRDAHPTAELLSRAIGYAEGHQPRHSRLPPAALLVSTIFWRSAWRYGKRGWREALLDTGHLMENLRLAAVGMGMNVQPRWHVDDQALRQLIGVSADADFAMAEAVQGMLLWNDQAEWPAVAPNTHAPLPPVETIPREMLSPQTIAYGSILASHRDCVDAGVPHRDIRWQMSDYSPMPKNFPTRKIVELDAIHDPGGPSLRQVLLSRRSPDDFAVRSISRNAFGILNAVSVGRCTHGSIDPGCGHAVTLVPFWVINGVSGVDNGIWFHHLATDAWAILRSGGTRKELAQFSMSQEICGRASAVCFLATNFYSLMHEAGPDVYRLAHFEAGAVGQRMALAAAAQGLACRCIGLYHDDDVRKFLGLDRTHWEIVYAVAVGIAPEAAAAMEQNETAVGGGADWRD